MRSAFSRRAVAAGLPIAALAAGGTTGAIAAATPDAELLWLGEALSAAWAREIAAHASDVATLDAAIEATRAVVDKIEGLRATTLAGLIVKARACHWCHCGEPIDAEFFDRDSTTDQRLAAGILGDLVAMGGANA